MDINEILEWAYLHLEIDNYKEWYALGLVNYGALHYRLETYYLFAFDHD